MLRYKTKTRPGLVALYDIGPGNGAGLFLQPRSPHGALVSQTNAVADFQHHSKFNDYDGWETVEHDFQSLHREQLERHLLEHIPLSRIEQLQ